MPTAADYIIQSPGAAIVPYPALQFLLTSDPVLGSTNNTLPDGPFNRELSKVHLNVGAVANLFAQWFVRTFGVVDENAPTDVTVVFTTRVGAPTTGLVNNQLHTVVFNDYEVLYRYNLVAGKWGELFRMSYYTTRVAQLATVSVVTLSENATEAVITPPDDYVIENIKQIYFRQDEDTFVSLGVQLCYKTDNTIIVKFHTPVPNDGYTMCVNWEKITVN